MAMEKLEESEFLDDEFESENVFYIDYFIIFVA